MSLLKRFLANPAQTHHELRVKLGMLDELAAEVFALTVFLCDDLLQLKPAAASDADPLRFFAIAKRLPSRRWLNEAEYSSQGFRGCLQISREESPFFLILSWSGSSRSSLACIPKCAVC